MGFGCANLYKNGFKSGQQTNSPNPAKAWKKLPETMRIASERLKNVQIECLPALELISRYDTDDVFMYIDPPYLFRTRKKYLYKYEMDDCEHEDLLKVLVKHPGKILLSGYENEMYNDYLSGWNKVHKNTRAENGLARTETLWMNYTINQGQISLFGITTPPLKIYLIRRKTFNRKSWGYITCRKNNIKRIDWRYAS